MLLAAACIGGDAQIQPCPAGVKDDLNWYTTTSSGKVHDCAWLRLDPDTRCNNDSVGGSFAARWARMVLKRCSSERGEREKRFYGGGKGERRRTAF